MTRTNLATQFGQVLQFASFQFGFADLTTAGLTQTITLQAQPTGNQGSIPSTPPSFTLNQGSFIVYIRIKHSVAFSGGTISAMTVAVGKTGGATNFFAPAFNIFQAVADGTLQETPTPPMGQLSACTLTATFTAVGGNVNTATAGVVNIDIAYVPVSTPTFTAAYGSGQVL